MRRKNQTLTGLGLALAMLAPGQLAADAKIYPYHGHNFCPAGYQPVTVGGVICCGQPNQHITYAQALAHGVKKHRTTRKHKSAHSARAYCPAGTKGCG